MGLPVQFYSFENSDRGGDFEMRKYMLILAVVLFCATSTLALADEAAKTTDQTNTTTTTTVPAGTDNTSDTNTTATTSAPVAPSTGK